MSCNRHYGIFGYPECSGKGKCVSGFCVCNPGWSSRGDFELIDGYDCDININIVKGLAIAYMILSFPALVYEIWVIKEIIRVRHIKFKQTSIIACLISNICGYIYASLKLYSPEVYLLGESVGLAVNQCVMVSAAFSIGSLYSIQLMSFLNGYFKMLGNAQKQAFREFTSKWKIIMIISPVWVFVSSAIIQFASIYGVRKDDSDKINLAISIVVLETNIIHLAFVVNVGNMFIHEIRTYVRDQDNQSEALASTKPTTNDIHNLLKSTQKIYFMVTQFLFNGVVLYIAIVSWKFLRRKASYFIIFQIFSLNMLAPFFLRALQSVSKVHSKGMKDMSSSQLNTVSRIRSAKPRVIPVSVIPLKSFKDSTQNSSKY